MRLSEAIRLGAMLHPQHFGSWGTYRNTRGQFCGPLEPGAIVAATCALGAANTAGFRNMSTMEAAIGIVSCPACDHWPRRGVMTSTIVHLNDFHLWTREEIADWVETVEDPGPRSSFLAYLGDTEGVDARPPAPSGVAADDREVGILVGV